MAVIPFSPASLAQRLCRVPLAGSKRLRSFFEMAPPPLLTSMKVALTLLADGSRLGVEGLYRLGEGGIKVAGPPAQQGGIAGPDPET